MTDSPVHEVVYTELDNGSTRASIIQDGERISGLTIVPFVIRIGAAEVRMDGIAGVSTNQEHRMKGLSRLVMRTSIDRMSRGDAAITMLYGIRDFYEKFGYTTAGPAHFVLLTDLQRDGDLPSGWQMRPFAADDLPALQEIYRSATSRASGARVRPADARVWTMLASPQPEGQEHECRVVTGPNGGVRAYALRTKRLDEPADPMFPNSHILAETLADGPESADALLAACRTWAREGGRKQVLMLIPPDTHVAEAAMRQDARLIQESAATGRSMVRVLNVKRLLTALVPEMEARLQSLASRPAGTLTIRTDIGGATLRIDKGGVEVLDAEDAGGLVVDMPQTALGRLALGALPPRDIIARLPEPPCSDAADLLVTLFPMRHPHMYAPDRF